VKLIETKTLTVAAASIEFTSIPQDATDLFLLVSGRHSGTGITQLNIQFNSSGGTAYSDRSLAGSGSAASSSSRTGQALIRVTSLPGTTYTSNTFSNTSVYVANYSGNTNKSVSLDGVSENNATESYIELVAGLWANTAAITTVTLTVQGGANFVIGSTVSLYKITSGSDGIVTVA
jgi:hypothetical protein